MRGHRTGAKARRLAMERQDARRQTRRAAISVAVVVLALVTVVILVRSAGAAHPDPREMDHTGHVLPHEHFAGHPRVEQGYAHAAAIPQVLDGIYCYCRCSQHSRHYSLLDCFVTEHAAACDICLTEAAVAYRMSREGAALGDIRGAIDALY